MKRDCIELGASIRDELLSELVCMITALTPEVRATVIRRALTLAPEETFEISSLVGEFRAALANCLLAFRGFILDAGTSDHLRKTGFQMRLIRLALSKDSRTIESSLLDLIDYVADAQASGEE